MLSQLLKRCANFPASWRDALTCSMLGRDPAPDRPGARSPLPDPAGLAELRSTSLAELVAGAAGLRRNPRRTARLAGAGARSLVACAGAVDPPPHGVARRDSCAQHWLHGR